MNNSETAAIGFASAGHTLCHLLTLLFPIVLLALEVEMELSYKDLAALAVPAAFLFGAGSLPAGWLGDRWSKTTLLEIFFYGTGFFTILTGFAQTPMMLAGGLAGIGLFASIYHPVGMSWLVSRTTKTGTALGFNGLFGSLGYVLAPLVAGSLTGMWSWRIAFIVPGIICIVVGILFSLALRTILNTAVLPAKKTTALTNSSKNIWMTFGLMGMALLLTGMFHQIIQFSLPKDFDLRVLLTSGSLLGTGSMVSLVYAAGAIGQLVCGRLADRYSERQLYFSLFLITTPLVALASQLTEIPLVMSMMLVVFMSTGALPVENTLLVRYAPSHRHGLVFGSKFLLGFGFSASGIYLSGWVFEYTGSFIWLYGLMVLLASGVAIIAFLLPGQQNFQPV
ncbi:MAG: MFS transporter [SAR324 cluster bacterium]|nr:MFS transporter [SAR324 cluster bacterium]MBL7034889.1 MFS transporter [SAR324 cluster bacterium]